MAARRERRVVRRIEPMSVLRVSLLFYLCLLVVALIAGVVLWVIASATGVLDNLEDFIGNLFLLREFRFLPGVILRSVMLGGLVLVVLGSGLNVLAAVLYNLISEVVGGLEVTLADEGAPPRPGSMV